MLKILCVGHDDVASFMLLPEGCINRTAARGGIDGRCVVREAAAGTGEKLKI